MRLHLREGGVLLIREEGDPELKKESLVTHHIRRLLNAEGSRRWVRFYPNKCGLTACRQGVLSHETAEAPEVYYWHEAYQIQSAHGAYNAGWVFFAKGGLRKVNAKRVRR